MSEHNAKKDVAGCACEGYTIRTDYGTGTEYDVDRSSCSIHAPSADKDALREEIRGVIVDEIGKRRGQIPAIHPRLLEGIEEAARIIVTYVIPSAPKEADSE